MPGVLKWLNLLAPWIWTTASITALIMASLTWLNYKKYEAEFGGNPVSRYVRRTSIVRFARSVSLSVVGLISIATWFAYPRPDVVYETMPGLLQLANFVTLGVLLAIPMQDIQTNYLTWKFVTEDTRT